MDATIPVVGGNPAAIAAAAVANSISRRSSSITVLYSMYICRWQTHSRIVDSIVYIRRGLYSLLLDRSQKWKAAGISGTANNTLKGDGRNKQREREKGWGKKHECKGEVEEVGKYNIKEGA